ncbi:hypothetical protein TRVL_04034 [Trypanosoma vivax]|uniref:Uncharacterized protein n=1 Tax=Trypanosoma vivax (strain Y486) TaxID=1055687 RepID=G0U9H9_TRYVY|nr:hypothetical protein TRVL_04034 [Trypanosoma vivax]CCC54265.1 hypothetical protein TVY486_1117490 [Trypanosoma vivax Y486]
MGSTSVDYAIDPKSVTLNKLLSNTQFVLLLLFFCSYQCVIGYILLKAVVGSGSVLLLPFRAMRALLKCIGRHLARITGARRVFVGVEYEDDYVSSNYMDMYTQPMRNDTG